MLDPEPWDIHPDLTRERLQAIAEVFRRVRGEAAELHDAAAGEGAWSFGCRVYERACFAFIGMAEDPACSWLKVLSPSLQFIFQVGDVPVRFYTGDPGRPRSNVLRFTDIEDAAQQLAFEGAGFEADLTKLFWRLAIVPGPDGQVLHVWLVQTNGRGDVAYRWLIPDDAKIPLMTTPKEELPQGVEQPPARVRLRTPATRTGEDDEG